MTPLLAEDGLGVVSSRTCQLANHPLTPSLAKEGGSNPLSQIKSFVFNYIPGLIG
jgi:hypothetical protein